MNIGERITALRTEHGLSQCELAKRAKLTQAAVSRIESGHSPGRADTIQAILAVFGCELDVVTRRKRKAIDKRSGTG